MRQDEFGGTGVGLAIVQRIVHLHGGQAGLTGTPHAGATAWFTLAPDAGTGFDLTAQTASPTK